MRSRTGFSRGQPIFRVAYSGIKWENKPDMGASFLGVPYELMVSSFMAAPPKTSGQNRRRHSKVQSSHVAPRGQRERVARPAERLEPIPPVRPPVRRSKSRTRRRATAAPETMTQTRGDQLEVVFSARMLSSVILFSLLVVLFLFFQADAFYVHRIEVGGLSYLAADEVFAFSGVATTHIFWVDPAEVEANILESPSVAAVEVAVGWPPHLLQIEVQERQPALVWEQAGIRAWIDVRGRVMPQRLDLAGLLLIITEGIDTPIGPHIVIPQDVVDGALQLRALYPNIETLIYNPAEGLGYQDARGWRAWFGSGTNMAAKLNVYDAIVAHLEAQGIFPEYVDVGNVDSPYYKVSWREDGQSAPGGEPQS